MGYKHTLIKNVECILDRAVYIHNKIYLDCSDAEREKKEALNYLEVIVRELGEKFERYKIQEVSIEKLDIAYTIAKEKYKKIFEDYPWIGKFDLNNGFVNVTWLF